MDLKRLKDSIPSEYEGPSIKEFAHVYKIEKWEKGLFDFIVDRVEFGGTIIDHGWSNTPFMGQIKDVPNDFTIEIPPEAKYFVQTTDDEEADFFPDLEAFKVYISEWCRRSDEDYCIEYIKMNEGNPHNFIDYEP